MLPNVEKSIYRVFRKAFFFKQKKDNTFLKKKIFFCIQLAPLNKCCPAVSSLLLFHFG